MFRTLMRSKLHRATVTEANMNYVGSLTLDRKLMELVDFAPHERVQVLDIDNGQRFETYIIEGPASSGGVCVNGAAARLVQPGDKVIVISYGLYDEREVPGHRPIVVLCDDANSGEYLAGGEQPSTEYR